jgi:hypothetical protein
MEHRGLERPHPAGILIVQGTLDGLVEMARRKVGLNTGIDGLRMALFQPPVELFHLLRAELIDCAFDFLNRTQRHDLTIISRDRTLRVARASTS